MQARLRERVQPQSLQKISQKNSKKFKKGIDKASKKWYNSEVARKAGRWSLKIEQQEMKYKAYLDM